MTYSINDLKRMLESVQDTYPDFVRYVVSEAEDYGIADQIIAFVDEHQGCSSSDIIDFVLDLLGFTEPLRIVEDE